MKKNFLRKIIFIFFILFTCNLFAQEGLLIRNIKNGKAWMYEKGARVTYIRFGEDDYTTATLNTLLDSAVIFGKDTVKLKSIAGIRKKNPLHKIARATGIPLMLVGSIFMGDALGVIYSNHDANSGTKFFLLGAGLFAIGYLPYQLNLSDLTAGIGGEWKIEICRGCLTQ